MYPFRLGSCAIGRLPHRIQYGWMTGCFPRLGIPISIRIKSSPPRRLRQSLKTLLAPAVPPAARFWMLQNVPGAGRSESLNIGMQM